MPYSTLKAWDKSTLIPVKGGKLGKKFSVEITTPETWEQIEIIKKRIGRPDATLGDVLKFALDIACSF